MKNMGCILCLTASTLTQGDQLKEEEPTDDIADEAVDEGFSAEVPNFNGEEGDYVDFFVVEDILNFSNNDAGEFYADEENYMFIREITADPFLSIFMAYGRKKEQEKYGKLKNCHVVCGAFTTNIEICR
jgi:hypothetical protein